MFCDGNKEKRRFKEYFSNLVTMATSLVGDTVALWQ